MPDDLRDLDRVLGGIRFEPRASLGPEIAGRAGGSGEQPGRNGGRSRFRLAALVAAALAAAAVTLGPRLPFLREAAHVTVDRCCYDLDGGGDEDDGVLVEAVPDRRVHRLRLYEDRDRSRTFTAGDVLRLDRGAEPAVHGSRAGGLVTIERCCVDFDGGGPSDDGLLVIGVPPDRVVMAAIYERRGDDGARAWRAPLR
jgi:hypothetical protein